MEYSKCRRNSYHRKLQLNTSINNQNEPMVWTDIALRCISIKMLRVICRFNGSALKVIFLNM